MRSSPMPPVILVAVMFIAPAFASPPLVSNIQLVAPGNRGLQLSSVPGTPHSNVRQRLEYGKGYRYGHRANGANGNIIIWSPAPYKGYGAAPHGSQLRPQPVSPVTPPIQYKPQYGKSVNPDYGQ